MILQPVHFKRHLQYLKWLFTVILRNVLTEVLCRFSSAAGQPRRTAGQPRRGAGEPRRGAGQLRRAAGQPRRGAGYPRRGAGQPRRGAGGQRRGAGEPRRRAGQPRRAAGQMLCQGYSHFNSKVQIYWKTIQSKFSLRQEWLDECMNGHND